jgi:hypothetical protein
LLLLVTVAWARPGDSSVPLSVAQGAAGPHRDQAHAARMARARNRGPGSVDFYEYVGVSMDVGPLETDAFSIDAANGALWRADSGVSLRMCDEADDYYCFVCPALSFAVPKAPMSVGQSWSRFGRAYAVIAQGPMRLLGKSIDVHVIESVDELDRKSGYYNSDQYGLWALPYRAHERTTTGTYYSKERDGYPTIAPAGGEDSTRD